MKWFRRRKPENEGFLTTTHTVGNRELILGIDHLYRDAMKCLEVDRLLPAAERVASVLGISPAEGPVEGYYGESESLTRYFRWMRALQQVSDNSRAHVASLPDFDLLWSVTQSPLYGVASDAPVLLPARRDALYFALDGLPPAQWTIPDIVEASHREAIARDDCSLVGLACRARDAVCIAALRESVVLYAEVAMAMAARLVRVRYAWAADPELSAAAKRFIDAFNAFVTGALPPADPSSAEAYFHAARNNHILDRCVRIGYNDQVMPVQHYHWAVDWGQDAYQVNAFWSEELWTTERYANKGRCNAPRTW
jgi:hypothetical protein